MADRAKILVLGATSAIAEQWARLRAEQGDSLLLVARDAEKLEAIRRDLEARGASSVEIAVEDLGETENASKRFDKFIDTMDGIDVTFIAYGILGGQDLAETDPAHLERILTINFSSAVLWAELTARAFQLQGQGTLIGISSVAGDRGRKTNYAYGAAKAGFSTYLAGMAHRFAGSDVHVLTVKPGFVDTPMTAHIENREGPLWATPEAVAKAIERAVRKRKTTVYTPWFWRFIMLIIIHLPRFVFNRMKI